MSKTSKALLEARNIHRTFKAGRHVVSVLKGASCAVRPNETVAIVGASGAGKSTLLHILGGLDEPCNGQVLVSGEDLYDLSGGARTRIRANDIGFVFQSYHLLPEMDVLENVILPARAQGSMVSAPEARERGMQLLESVGLGERADHTPMELSGGEQQRAALARALMNSPRLVLADEPTGNLDEKTGDQVLNILFGLTRDRGHTLVLVTHDPRIAKSCDRILRLEAGTIKQAR